MKKLLTTVVMGATFLLASCGTKSTNVTPTTQENSVKQVQFSLDLTSLQPFLIHLLIVLASLNFLV